MFYSFFRLYLNTLFLMIEVTSVVSLCQEDRPSTKLIVCVAKRRAHSKFLAMFIIQRALVQLLFVV